MLDVGVKAAAAIIDAFGKIVGAITPVLNFVISAINKVIDGINLVKGGADIQKLSSVGGASGGGLSGSGLGQVGGLAAGGFTGGGGAGGGGTGGGGGGVGGGLIGGAVGATSLQNLADQLINVQDKFADLTFQVATGGISRSAAQKQFDALEAQFRVLEKQGKTLAANPSIVINVSGAIDPEGTARAVANQLNSQAARSVTALRDRVN
jgi:hypothetical protein